ncbi:reverse transcriptase [Gossypium australe]|uniref:Reverse transcriptase n=1 Tax=Gossypium australe TaxID=47621 RepID=A0A5B6V5T6_9ROSI|nr:reverse transcriptase [Gossypium australe]
MTTDNGLGIQACRHGPIVSHLSFSDDSLLFAKASQECSERPLNMLKIREIFIKAVLQAIPIYAMQCFLFIKPLCDEITNKKGLVATPLSFGEAFGTAKLAILHKGARWPIGNGLTTRIKVVWIPSQLNSLAPSSGTNFNEESKREFSKEEAEAICKVPLMNRNAEDKLIWNWNADGNYTVQNGCAFNARIQGASFACLRCGNESKDIMYALRERPIAKSALALSGFSNHICDGDVNSGVDWIEIAA